MSNKRICANEATAKRRKEGDKLFICEAWTIYQTRNYVRRPDGRAFSEISDGLYAYKADGFESIADFKEHIRLMSDKSFEEVYVLDDKWHSPATMSTKDPNDTPCRHVWKIGKVEAVQFKDLFTLDKIVKLGIDEVCIPDKHLIRWGWYIEKGE